MIWFGWVLWHIKHYRLCNTKSSLYIYSKYIWFDLIWLGLISTIVGYFMPKIKQVPPLWARVDLVAMAMKEYSSFPKSSRLESDYHIVQCHIKDTFWWGGVLPLCNDAVGIFYNPNRLGNSQLWVKSYLLCSYTSEALALNNPWMLICY